MSKIELTQIKALLLGLSSEFNNKLDEDTKNDFIALNSGWIYINKGKTAGINNLAISFDISFEKSSPIEKSSTVYNNSIREVMLFSLNVPDIDVAQQIISGILTEYKGQGNNYYINLNDAINTIIAERKRQEAILSKYLV